MSSGAKPQWGHRPEGFQGDSPFGSDLVREIAQMHGISDIEHLAAGLDAIAGQKAVAEYIEKADIPARDQRAAVAVMIKEAQSLLDHLQSADLSTRETIFANYPNVRLDHEPDERTRKLGLFSRDIEHLKRLLHGLEAAERALPKTGGRPPLRVLSQACLELIKLYERGTGRDFTRYCLPDKTGLDAFPPPRRAICCRSRLGTLPRGDRR